MNTQDKALNEVAEKIGRDKDGMYWSGKLWYTLPDFKIANSKKIKLIGCGETKELAKRDLKNQQKLYDTI